VGVETYEMEEGVVSIQGPEIVFQVQVSIKLSTFVGHY
jgi:hypothetical protein